MLVLSRFVGESIRIGDVIVKIDNINSNQVSIAIDAPREVKVCRTEVCIKYKHNHSVPYAKKES